MMSCLRVLVGLALAIGIVPAANASTPLTAVFTADDPAGNMGGARVRVVHASPDAPAVDILVNDAAVFQNLPYEGITSFVEVPAGTYNVKVVPAGATTPVVFEADLGLAAATDYTVVATGLLADFAPVILTADGSTPAPGNAWVRFLHASPDAPAVDIAVTGGPVLLPNVAFRQSTAYIPVPAGTYDLEARIAGTSDVALALPGVTVADGGVYTAYAIGLVADIGVLDELSFIPAAARGGGAEDSFWTTDVDIQNGANRPVQFQYLWLPRDTDNATPDASDVFTVAPGEVIRHSDVLAAAFGVPDGVDAFGALAVLADSDDLLFYSRTFNTAATGTYGQGFPGVASEDLIPANLKKRILFFTENAASRSNIAILNGVGSPITVSWERYLSDGTLVESASAEIPAWGNVQLNRVFQGEAPVAGGYIDVWTETEDGAFFAFGSVLDNLTSDPTTVLPQ